jgi:ElaB/YqjD/DUF883 family membrane-anchored ribosome-binding protein
MANGESTGSDFDTEKLMADLAVVVADAEELLRATADQAGEKATAAREKIHASLVEAKQRLSEAERAMRDKTDQLTKATCEYVEEHPWQVAGIAAGVGLLVGLLVGRR